MNAVQPPTASGGSAAAPGGLRNGAWRITDLAQMEAFWPGGRFWVPGGGALSGRIFRRALPQMQLEGIEATPYAAERTGDLLQEYPGDLLVVSGLVEGQGEAESDGERLQMRPGDVLVHRGRSMRYRCDTPSRTFRVVLPAELVCGSAAAGFHPFERLEGAVLSSAFIRYAHEVLRSVAREPVLLARTEHRLEEALLPLLKGVVGEVLEHDRRSVDPDDALLIRIEQHIEEHLTDPDLTGDTIGRALNVSRRRVYQVFEQETESLMTSIRRRRIEALTAAFESNPRATQHDLAQRFGFSSVSTLARAFQAHHGVTFNTMRAELMGRAPTAPRASSAIEDQPGAGHPEDRPSDHRSG